MNTDHATVVGEAQGDASHLALFEKWLSEFCCKVVKASAQVGNSSSKLEKVGEAPHNSLFSTKKRAW